MFSRKSKKIKRELFSESKEQEKQIKKIDGNVRSMVFG